MAGSSQENGNTLASGGARLKRVLPPEVDVPPGSPSDGAPWCRRLRPKGQPKSGSLVVNARGGLLSRGIEWVRRRLGGLRSPAYKWRAFRRIPLPPPILLHDGIRATSLVIEEKKQKTFLEPFKQMAPKAD
jgi:hypothetical protein